MVKFYAIKFHGELPSLNLSWGTSSVPGPPAVFLCLLHSQILSIKMTPFVEGFKQKKPFSSNFDYKKLFIKINQKNIIQTM